jgi:predicted permease
MLWRLRAMFRRDRLMTEKAEEMQLHLDMEIEAGLRRGLSLAEAKRLARMRAGLVSEGLEPTREAHGIRWLDGAWGDLRHAYRALTRNPGFGAVTILVLAASVAINTLIFFMLDGVVLRPLPYPAPERLVRLFDAGTTQPKFPLAIAHYLDYRAHAKSLASIALYTGRDMELSGNDTRSQQLVGLQITTDYFTVLGRPLHLGQAFTDSDLDTEIPHVIISHRLWRDHFQSDPAIVGKPIRLNRQAWTIIGVAAEGFQHVGGSYRSPMQGETVDIWLPLTVKGERPRRGYHFSNAIARLRDGVTEAQARQELQQLAAQAAKQFPDYGDWGLRMEPLLGEVTGASRQVIWLLMAAGGLVMLVACANIAGLCVARAVARRKELALRHALGANRWQLLRVGLAENLLIGIAGATLGLLFAGLGLPLLRQLLPADFPRAHEIGLTSVAAIFATGVALATVLLAGLLPAGRSNTLESQARVTGGRDSRRLRTTLVVGEIALAGLLCAGALFLLRSFQEITARDHGFEPANTLTFQISVPFTRTSADDYRTARIQESIRTNIAAIPGVKSVGASTNLPWSGYDENAGFTIVGRTPTQDNSGFLDARYQAASPGYFEATGMRLISGRLFDPTRDVQGQPLVLIVNDAVVSRYFPKGDAVGTIVDTFGGKRQIIGVVKSLKDYPADLDAKPGMWFPLGQQQFDPVFFAVHSTSVDPTSLTAAVTAAVHAVDPDLPLAGIRTLQRRADSALASRRFALWLFQSFAALALMLAAAGIYGLLAYVVRQRRKELGIRAALGASRTDLWTMVLADGLKMAIAGALGCLLLIPLGGSLLQAFLYNVRAFDPFTLVGAPLALLVVAFIASLGPARSATRSDPSLALRED